MHGVHLRSVHIDVPGVGPEQGTKGTREATRRSQEIRDRCPIHTSGVFAHTSTEVRLHAVPYLYQFY